MNEKYTTTLFIYTLQHITATLLAANSVIWNYQDLYTWQPRSVTLLNLRNWLLECYWMKKSWSGMALSISNTAVLRKPLDAMPVLCKVLSSSAAAAFMVWSTHLSSAAAALLATHEALLVPFTSVFATSLTTFVVWIKLFCWGLLTNYFAWPHTHGGIVKCSKPFEHSY